MIKVFLCHASLDKPRVRKLYSYLRRQGVDVWLDDENLIAGQDWKIEIPKALDASDAIIICLSQNSIDKEGYIQKEIRFALDKALEIPEGRIFLIPARLEDCKVPDKLNNYHWVDLFEKSGYAKLTKSVKIREEQVREKYLTVSTPEHELARPVYAEDESDSSPTSISNVKSAESGGIDEAEDTVTAPIGNDRGIVLDDFDLSQLPYSIAGEIGRGDYSVVYLATHKMLGTNAAIKLFHPSIAASREKNNNLVKNIMTASDLRHPNFINIYSLGFDTNLLAIAMEYIQGGNLHKWAAATNRSFHEILFVLGQVAEGLDFLHKQRDQDGNGLLHLNVKPENVLVDMDVSSMQNRVLLTDFGMSVSMTDIQNEPMPKGIPAQSFYVSPEQAEGLPRDMWDGRTDQYSLGVVAYELFTGKRPFDGKDMNTVITKRLDDIPILPSQSNSDLPIEIDVPILKALNKIPELRYTSCGDFIRALYNALQDSTLRKTKEFIENAQNAMQEKDFDTALAELKQAAFISPKDERVLDLLKLLNEKQELSKKYSEAMSEWQNARQKAVTVLDLAPNYPDSNNLFSTLGLRFSKEKINLKDLGIQIMVGGVLSIPVVFLLVFLIIKWIFGI